MKKKVAVFIGLKENDDIITGGERQLQELIKGLRRHEFDIVCLEVNAALESISELVLRYDRKDIYVFSDYSKRFALYKTIWKCKLAYGVTICASVGAFYFDYRTSKLKNIVDYIVSYFYLKPADIIFTTGEAVNSKLRSMGCSGMRIVSVYPALRESLVAEAGRDCAEQTVSEKRIVLTVGRFHPVKGYDYLLDAVKLCKDIPNIHFLIVGDYERKPDDYYQKILARIHAEGLEEYVTICGRTKDDVELASYYRQAWCYLHTSVWESSPITVCEPLLFGKPVIATNVGGTGEYLQDKWDSLLVESKSGCEIANAIKELYVGEDLYFQMSINAGISAKKYVKRSWDDVGEEYYSAMFK